MKHLLFICSLVVLLGILAFRFVSAFSSYTIFTDGQKVTINTTLRQQPTISYGKQHFSVKSKGFEPIYITVGLFPEYRYADTIRINGTIERKVLDGGRTIATLAQPRIELISQDKHWYQVIRLQVTALYQQTLSPVGASLMLGIVFGSKEQMPKEFEEALEKEGLTHIIAASGMNVTIVGGIILSVFSQILTRKIALGAVIVGIFLYCLLTGLESSIVRASIMGIAAYTASMTGRQQWGFISLVLAGYLMLFYDPLLISDVGFQLSFLATSGIMYIKPICEKMLFTKKSKFIVTKFFKEDVTTTLSAQLATFPLLLAVFGEINLMSVISNVLLLWTIPLFMLLGIFAAVVGLLVPLLGKLILLLTLPLLWYFEAIVELTKPLYLPVTLSSSLPIVVITAYYIFLLAIITWKPYEKGTSH